MERCGRTPVAHVAYCCGGDAADMKLVVCGDGGSGGVERLLEFFRLRFFFLSFCYFDKKMAAKSGCAALRFQADALTQLLPLLMLLMRLLLLCVRAKLTPKPEIQLTRQVSLTHSLPQPHNLPKTTLQIIGTLHRRCKSACFLPSLSPSLSEYPVATLLTHHCL